MHPMQLAQSAQADTCVVCPSHPSCAHLNSATKNMAWPDTLITPLPITVAPKNCQNGIRNAPQQMPHRSNAAFGQLASSRMPRKPCCWMTRIIQACMDAAMRVIMLACFLAAGHKQQEWHQRSSWSAGRRYCYETGAGCGLRTQQLMQGKCAMATPTQHTQSYTAQSRFYCLASASAAQPPCMLLLMTTSPFDGSANRHGMHYETFCNNSLQHATGLHSCLDSH